MNEYKEIKNLGRIGVVMGGCSSEREISFKSGRAVVAALQEAGADVVEVVIDSVDAKVNAKVIRGFNPDIVFIALHGSYGEDGGIQILLEDMGLAYAGSGPEASQRAIDKVVTQTLLRQAGIPVADFFVVDKNMSNPEVAVYEFFQGDPVVVKPATQGSSIGIYIIEDYGNLGPALAQAFEYDDHVLIEHFVKGRELTVGILREQALPIVEIRSGHRFFDYEAKYQKGLTEYSVPASLDAALARHIQELALRAFQAVGCRDFSRVDLLLSEEGNPYFLEINTIPGFTETSLLPMAARCAGYEFSRLCVTLVQMAQARHQFQ